MRKAGKEVIQVDCFRRIIEEFPSCVNAGERFKVSTECIRWNCELFTKKSRINKYNIIFREDYEKYLEL